MKSDKKRVLITGGSGLLASSAWLNMKSMWDITLAVRDPARAPQGYSTVLGLLEDEAQVAAMLERARPDLIVHAAGMTNVEDCEAHKYAAHVSNVIASKIVAKCAAKYGARLIHVSTDHFASDKTMSLEGEIGFPLNNYALTKLQAEYEVLGQHPTALVARTNFFSWGLPHRRTFFDQIVESLRSSKEVTLFDDVSFNPLSAAQLLSYFDQLDNRGAAGVFNLVADQVITKLDFGMTMAQVFGLPTATVKVGHLTQSKSLVRRPKNLALSNEKMKKTLGISSTPSLSDMIASLRDSEAEDKKAIQAAFSRPAQSFISYGKQSIEDSDYESVMATLGSSNLTQGPKVEEFEARVAESVGAKYGVAMANWTLGLHMAVLAADVGPGDHVITSPITFMASSNCAVYAGATPHFADIDPKTLNLCPDQVDALCRKIGKVKAIIPVHLCGAPCDMKRLREVADRHGAALIEDAAHALGGSYLSGEKIGANVYSKMVGFSFHPVKNITTGEGGLITTDDEKIYRKLLRLRSHGINKIGDKLMHVADAYHGEDVNPWYHEMQELGYNYRITDLQCALGLSQLKRLRSMHAKRVEIAKSYDLAFGELPCITLNQRETRNISGNHLYTVRIDFSSLGKSRYEVMHALRKLGVGSHVHYIPVYRQPYYVKNFPVDRNQFPHAEQYYATALTLPLYPGMSDNDVSRVVKAIRTVIT